MPTVQFFEIPEDDLERVKRFYRVIWMEEKKRKQIMRTQKIDIFFKQPAGTENLR
jgi:predicted enzyme related to lactoylglutathione lyase